MRTPLLTIHAPPPFSRVSAPSHSSPVLCLPCPLPPLSRCPSAEIVVMSALNFSVFFFDVARLVAHASDRDAAARDPTGDTRGGGGSGSGGGGGSGSGGGGGRGGGGHYGGGGREGGDDDDDDGPSSGTDFRLLSTLYTSTPQQGLVWHPSERVLFGYGGSDAKVRDRVPASVARWLLPPSLCTPLNCTPPPALASCAMCLPCVGRLCARVRTGAPCNARELVSAAPFVAGGVCCACAVSALLCAPVRVYWRVLAICPAIGWLLMHKSLHRHCVFPSRALAAPPRRFP
jgi:hypothetical protein